MTSRSAWRQRMVGGGIVAAIVLFAVLEPIVSGTDPARQNLSNTLTGPGWPELLGTDHYGRSVLSRLAQAVRVSFGLAALAVVTAAIPGTLLGLVAAWRGGWTDRVLSWVGDGVLALPGLMLVILLVSIAPGQFWLLYVAISLTLWVEYFRVVRAVARQVLNSPQVEASRLLGFEARYVVVRHVVPEVAPLILTLMTFGAATAILAVASLGYIRIGLRPPTAELGQMMAEFFPLYEQAPWLIASPVALLTVTILGLALLTSGGRK